MASAVTWSRIDGMVFRQVHSSFVQQTFTEHTVCAGRCSPLGSEQCGGQKECPCKLGRHAACHSLHAGSDSCMLGGCTFLSRGSGSEALVICVLLTFLFTEVCESLGCHKTDDVMPREALSQRIVRLGQSYSWTDQFLSIF